MLHQLRAMAIFAKTVEHGSFRSAAKALGLSPSVVSHHISQLEDQVGVALLYRSTRKFSLTHDGEIFFRAARAMTEAAEDGLNTVMDRARRLAGTLRLTAPAILARSRLANQIVEFSAAHPDVRMVVDYSENPRDIIAGAYDIAIRMGTLRDSNLRTRKIAEVGRSLLAAPSYLASRPAPKTPRDVEGWDWLKLTPVPLNPSFTNGADKRVTLRPKSKISANNATALYEMAKAGAGLVTLPDILAEDDLSDAKMIPVLPDWKLAQLSIYAVWPENAPRAGLTAAFVSHLTGQTKSAG